MELQTVQHATAPIGVANCECAADFLQKDTRAWLKISHDWQQSSIVSLPVQMLGIRFGVSINVEHSVSRCS